VFLRDGGFNALGQQGVRVRRSCIRSGQGQIDEFLVSERLAGGAVVGPVLLILIEVQQAFEHGDEDAQAGGDQLVVGEGQRGQKRDGGGGQYLDNLDALEDALRRPALAVVPVDLVFEPAEDRVGFRVRDRDGGGTGWVVFRHRADPQRCDG